MILQESQGNSYVYGLDLISRTDSGGVQEYYLYDGLGSTTELTDANEFTFTGEQSDTAEGLYYLRARYYDPGGHREVQRGFSLSRR